MRAVIQRVSQASVTIDGEVKAEIGHGYMILLGCENADTAEDIEWLSKKIVNLRVMDDDQGVMNRSILDSGGDILLVSSSPYGLRTRKATGQVTSVQAATTSPSHSTTRCAGNSLPTSVNLYTQANSVQT